jgi:hypothetical protein
MATLLRQVALVSEAPSVDMAAVARVSAALQKQAVRDFSPIWDVEATVDPFATLDDVPIGYWPMIIMDDIGFDAAGIHLDKDGQPYALISSGRDWSLTASHELVEMLADPFGDRLVAGDSPKPDQGRVEFLVEVADPSEAAEFGYTVNGVLVSDFYTPQFFDPVVAQGVRYSFTGAISEPREVLRGGYLSWHDPVSDEWWQETWFNGNHSSFRNLGRLSRAQGSFRSQIDRLTTRASAQAMQVSAKASNRSTVLEAVSASATSAKAASWHAQITQVLNKPKPDRTQERTRDEETKRRRPGGRRS